MTIFTTIATVVGCVSACIALAITIIKPFRKWIIESFVRQSQYKQMATKMDSISEKMDILIKKNDALETRLTRVEENVLENEADRIRAELFDCGNRCRRGIRLHPEEFDHIKEIYRKYTDVLHQNHEGETEYNFIHEYYTHQRFPEYHEHNQ
jgi:hypothetical protein